ncbi:hypothetical protein DFJ58DRAFT_16691, partial [Suillus subalutaceus]|uniref:uncharacterized protein n=1 Tax=Suillus subalutaceus TaxID=48586 RepID=UPI001B885DB2
AYISVVHAFTTNLKFPCFASHLCFQTMATPPARKAVLDLYASTLRTAKSFSSYNFRTYFVQRTEDTFRGMQR